MKTSPLWQVDAFTDRIFGGNPAAVVALEDDWPSENVLQAIAAENNLSETAFLLTGRDPLRLRWFTPRMEVPLCGHATLAAAFVFTRYIEPSRAGEHISFETKSGPLLVATSGTTFVLDFPAIQLERSDVEITRLAEIIGAEVLESFATSDRYVCVLKDETTVASLSPDIGGIRALPLPGLVVTALADDGSFVSRYFAPAKGVEEDPVTGTSHCALAPFWGERLGKSVLLGRQLSHRAGTIRCEVKSDRVLLEGEARLYMRGEIHIPS